MTAIRGLATATLVLAACGGNKTPATERAAPPATATVKPAPDSAMGMKAMPDRTTGDTVAARMKADSVARADSAAKAGKAAPMHDSAFGPRFKVDSNGKVTPINPVKRP